MPSQPLAPTSAMNARRFGVSTIWAMFSRVRSKTSGSSCSSRNFCTSAAKASCSGEKSKSMGVSPQWASVDEVAGVHHQRLRGDHAGAVGGEEHDRVGDVAIGRDLLQHHL